MTNTVDIDEDRLYRYIGEQIKRHRTEAGLTQAQLAARSGVLRTSIANVETTRQKVPLDLLYRLCISLEIETRAILPLNEQAFAHPVELDVNGVIKEVPPKAARLLERLLKD